jgi:hypothetical protein
MYVPVENVHTALLLFSYFEIFKTKKMSSRHKSFILLFPKFVRNISRFHKYRVLFVYINFKTQYFKCKIKYHRKT